MNVNIENPSALRRKLTIELEPAEIDRELNRAYNELKRSVQLKGFRQGHAPRNLLEHFFGDQVRGEVIQKLIKEYTDKALEENSFVPVVAPEIVTEETDLKKALRFSAVFDLKPEIAIKDYQELKVPKGEVAVTDEDVEAALERLRERSATLKKVDGRTTVEPGDFVIAAFEGFEDGKPIAGTKIDDRLLEVSERSLAHGLDQVLAGAEIGKEARQSRSYGGDYAEKEIAGKTVEWHATVRDIFKREMPNLDDEFAKDQGEFQSLAELREALRKDLLVRAQQDADARARQGLLDLIIERNPIEVPESLVAREERALESEIASALEAGGMPHEQAHERARANGDELKARAHKRALSALVVDAMADQEKIEVSGEDVADRIAAMVTQSGRQRERVAEYYAQEENRAALAQAMRREKTLEFLLSRAQAEAAPAAGASSPEA